MNGENLACLGIGLVLGFILALVLLNWRRLPPALDADLLGLADHGYGADR